MAAKPVEQSPWLLSRLALNPWQLRQLPVRPGGQNGQCSAAADQDQHVGGDQYVKQRGQRIIWRVVAGSDQGGDEAGGQRGVQRIALCHISPHCGSG